MDPELGTLISTGHFRIPCADKDVSIYPAHTFSVKNIIKIKDLPLPGTILGTDFGIGIIYDPIRPRSITKSKWGGASLDSTIPSHFSGQVMRLLTGRLVFGKNCTR